MRQLPQTHEQVLEARRKDIAAAAGESSVSVSVDTSQVIGPDVLWGPVTPEECALIQAQSPTGERLYTDQVANSQGKQLTFDELEA